MINDDGVGKVGAPGVRGGLGLSSLDKLIPDEFYFATEQEKRRLQLEQAQVRQLVVVPDPTTAATEP